MGSLIDLTGQRFGRLVVAERAANRGKNISYWWCICDCGTEKEIRGSNLRHGATRSCGCLLSERARETHIIHGKCHERIYNIWLGMRQRCSNKQNPAYYRYGGRGITVCNEWNDFQAFYQWAMANGYSDDLTIDRIDNMKNYYPQNCRWTTWGQQGINRRNNTKFPGVHSNKHSTYFRAHLQTNGKIVLHRYFKTQLEAIAARLQAEQDCGITLTRKGENNRE